LSTRSNLETNIESCDYDMRRKLLDIFASSYRSSWEANDLTYRETRCMNESMIYWMSASFSSILELFIIERNFSIKLWWRFIENMHWSTTKVASLIMSRWDEMRSAIWEFENLAILKFWNPEIRESQEQ
jgi:hypothetical protein